jgi:general secretion pathway protein G
MRTRKIRRQGFTFIELLAVTSIIAILAAAAVPLTKIAIKREKEIELRRNLRLIREAVDAYKRLADEKRIEVEEDSEGYPPDLETLVKGVEVKETAASAVAGPGGGLSRTSEKAEPKIQKFLRRIPLDPMTNSTDWGLRSYQDEPDSDSWGEENVYDIYTKSNATALDGTKYKDW